MFVEFETLSDDSRVWVYQADRTFSADELALIKERLLGFVQGWQKHGEDLKASFKIVYNQFIVLAVDENYNNVSGCSIDASVHIVQDLENEFKIDLLNKMKVTFKDGPNINTVSLQEFKQFAKAHKIHANTVVFNNMVSSKADFETTWEVEASKSWHSKFLV